jgi:exodeoxyribonuclease V alpha subunit
MEQEIITGTFIRERHRFDGNNGGDDTIIGDIETNDCYVTVKGRCFGPHPISMRSYRFYGNWIKYTNKRTGIEERQFAWKEIEEIVPASKTAVVAFLASIPSFSKRIADKLHKQFGDDVLTIADETPELMVEGGYHENVVAKVTKAVRQHRGTLKTATEVAALLSGKGFPRRVWQEVIDTYGKAAPAMIRENPFILRKFKGVGFRLCDKLWLDLGLGPAKLQRQKQCVLHAMESDGSGSTVFPATYLLESLKRSIGSYAPMLDRVIEELTAEGEIETYRTNAKMEPDWDGEILWVQLAIDAEAERVIAHKWERITRLSGDWPLNTEKAESLTPHQRQKLGEALAHEFAIFGGGPGTGKTFCSARVVDACLKDVGPDNVALITFTGKAAVRSTEVMFANGVHHRCATAHSVIFNESWNPDYLIIDEPSMIDAELMGQIMARIPEHCKVLLVGDVRQLPPVGRGAPLRDMIDAGVGFVELTETARNEGGIVRACKSIVEGKLPNFSQKLFDPSMVDDNCAFWKADSYADLVMAIRELEGIIERQGYDPVKSLQVITALNKNGAMNRADINHHFQSRYTGVPKYGTRFNAGDKIICRKNQIVECETEDGDKIQTRVANGDQGYVKNVYDGEKFVDYIVDLNSPFRRLIVREFKNAKKEDDESEGDESAAETWELAYAISCHSSQGSEYPFTLVTADNYPGAIRLSSREWWNTAVSRAKIGCLVVGSLSAIEAGIRKTSTRERRTLLKWRLQHLI